MLMLSIYADAHMGKNVVDVHKLRTHIYAQKKAGKAWIEVDSRVIEVDGRVQELYVGEKNFFHNCEILNKLIRLYKLSKDKGLTMQLGLVWELS